MTEDRIFILFTNSKAVAGSRRAIICDLQRGNFDFIPNDLFKILSLHKNKNLKQIRNIYVGSESIIDDYFSFLVSNDYGFWGDLGDQILFPDLDMTWCTPSRITHSIIDIDEKSNHNFEDIFTELETIGCKDLQIRAYCEISISNLDRILSMLLNSRIKSIELITKYSELIYLEELQRLTMKHLRMRNLIIHSSPDDKLAVINKNGRGNIIYVSDRINAASHCGIIAPSTFVVNLPTFIESQKNNSCLNGKISIDVEGNIKNCPSMTKSFGFAGKDSLKDVSLKEEFQNAWYINKEQIEICRDCEFRYICTDCRAYLKDSSNPNSKPLKCAYDPYTAKWLNEKV
ncbi:MAG TPA: grasp-with-spasm system SPASM domain peptide maturase [Bacteroidia bacterium]|jgi:SPASM domain peptide maturase of grasp-with-spasm system|nr:grasp-with-spasm system SPASM domain peptide maturase [Bacteroidia bacterium]